MADLFDLRVGGAGWHLTSHLIAIAALFVACFAITGYITFRDDSIPGDALKDEGVDLSNIDADTLTLTGNATVSGDLTINGNVSAGMFTNFGAFINSLTPANVIGGATSAHTATKLGSFALKNDNIVLDTRTAVVAGDTTSGIEFCNDLFGTSKTAFVAELDITTVSAAADFGTLVDGLNFVKASGDPGANDRTHTLPTPSAGKTIVVAFSSTSALDAAQTMSFECTTALDDNTTLIDTATNTIVDKVAAANSIVRYTSGAANEALNGFIVFKPAGTSYQVISILSEVATGSIATVA